MWWSKQHGISSHKCMICRDILAKKEMFEFNDRSTSITYEICSKLDIRQHSNINSVVIRGAFLLEFEHNLPC